MMTHPGKKLLFMGGEIGQFREWSEERELDWSVLNYQQHQGLQAYVQDLNHLYLESKPLYENELNWDGFRWLMVNDANHNVLAYERKDYENHSLYIILNFAYCNWENYLLPLDNGLYEVVLSSSDKQYGGNIQLKSNQFIVINQKLKINLPSNTGIILRKVEEYV